MRTIQMATSRLAAAAMISTVAGAMPATASPAVITAPTAIATAFTTLLAAIMRACSARAERSCITAYSGTE
jgi:hypothetical protein